MPYPMPSLRTIGLLLALATLLAPGRTTAQMLERRHEALRDVTATRVVISTFPNRDPTLPCVLDAAALERRGVETLRAAGLRALTFAEVMAQSRRDGESLAQDLDAQKRREGLDLDSPEQRRRAASIDFLRGLPTLQLLFSTTSVPMGSSSACALATYGSFFVFLTEDAVSGATGHRTSTTGGLRAWEAPLGAHAAPEADLPQLALTQLDAMTGAFLGIWRRVNGR